VNNREHGALADCEVEAFLDEVDHAFADGQVDRHLGVENKEFADHRCEEA
jgi:hypothetical protein